MDDNDLQMLTKIASLIGVLISLWLSHLLFSDYLFVFRRVCESQNSD